MPASAPRERPAAGSAREADPGFGVYVHWPFCRLKCPYCDFNSHAAPAVDHARWRRALVAELRRAARATPGRAVASVFFGGGTPSLMEPATVAAVIDAVADRWPTASGLEVTLEANPTSVEADKFRGFRAAGVNRVSLGVQALDDGALRLLGRGHTAAEARAAVALAARCFERYSFDLIYARPGQTAESWRRELKEALVIAGEHLSLYQLAIEPGTPFHRDGVPAAPEGLAADLYAATQEALAAAGLPAYEVSNHARPGAECRHNLAVWRGGDYVGIGPGAHGRITGTDGTWALHQIYDPARWLAAVEEKGDGTAKRRLLGAEEREEELLLLGLRLAEGVDRRRFARLAGRGLDAALDLARLRRLVDGGFLAADARSLTATAAGRLRLNAVLAALLG
jgi:oxygen-independent coproporphyrinogen-3 oxidase